MSLSCWDGCVIDDLMPIFQREQEIWISSRPTSPVPVLQCGDRGKPLQKVVSPTLLTLPCLGERSRRISPRVRRDVSWAAIDDRGLSFQWH